MNTTISSSNDTYNKTVELYCSEVEKGGLKMQLCLVANQRQKLS